MSQSHGSGSGSVGSPSLGGSTENSGSGSNSSGEKNWKFGTPSNGVAASEVTNSSPQLGSTNSMARVGDTYRSMVQANMPPPGGTQLHVNVLYEHNIQRDLVSGNTRHDISLKFPSEHAIGQGPNDYDPTTGNYTTVGSYQGGAGGGGRGGAGSYTPKGSYQGGAGGGGDGDLRGRGGGGSMASICSVDSCGNWTHDLPCPPCHGACSDDPNCHTFKEKCPKRNFDDFYNPFKPRRCKRPAWLEGCGEVLRFYAFYQEPIPESGLENYRVHKCEIRYYMDNGTIEVYEPKTYDPGFTQGMLIRRHKIPYPEPAQDYFYQLDDINVGCEVEFYGKTFFISGCDSFTRQRMNRMGRAVLPNIEMPSDPYTIWREDRVKSLFSRKANIKLDQDKFKKFLANQGKVLRFWAYWDDRCHEGDLRRFLVHYFLEDDTIEIKEITDPQGRIRGAVNFLNKGKLLKNSKDLVTLPGNKEEAILILNTNGPPCAGFMDLSFMTDRLCPGVEHKEFVTDRDLAIGAVLNVYGRNFVLTECDKATQIYYKEKYGIEDFTPLELKNEEKPKPTPKMETPPHIGIGDELDTFLNWDKLEPTQPKKDELALLVQEKDVLGFDASFNKPLNKVNGDRRFIIKIYMMDNTMQIFEKPHPNTGMKQGTFLSRSKVRRNGSGLPPRYELGETSEYYNWSEYHVGNVLDINGFQFLLMKADEFTHCYMEANSHLFPQSNICLILEKLKEIVGCLHGQDLLSVFTEKDTKLNGIMDPKDLRLILLHLSKFSLNEHEITTVIRAFRVVAPNPPLDMSTLQSVIQTELQRGNFDKHLLARVEYTLRDLDPCRTGLINREALRSTLKGARLPVQKKLIDFLVDHFEAADDCDRVNYCCVMRFIDWIDNAVPKALPSHEDCVLKWVERKPPAKIFCLNYAALLEKICPNILCALPNLCCPKECEDECPKEPFPRDCPISLGCEPTERDLAGQVISDNQVSREEFRCQEEDQRAQGCFNMDPDRWRANNQVRWTSRDYQHLDPCMLDAYRPHVPNDCIPAEAGRKELYRPGDFIGWEDFYK